LEAALDIPETYGLHLRLFRGSDGAARYADGRAVGPVHEPGLLAFLAHSVVAPTLGGRDLLPAGGADHWLVLDRHRRRLDLVPAEYGRGLLFCQWPPWIPFHVGRVAWDPAAVGFQPRPPTPAEQLDDAVRDMLAWLDIMLAWRF
jgi:hypothetical protein